MNDGCMNMIQLSNRVISILAWFVWIEKEDASYFFNVELLLLLQCTIRDSG